MTPEKMTPERMRPAIKFWDGQRWRFCPDCQRKAFEFAAEFGEHILAAYRATQEEDAGAKGASLGLLVKLGSIAVHAEEIMEPGRHRFDLSALSTLLEDAEVKEWLAKMQKQAFLPVKR